MKQIDLSTALWFATVSALATAVAIGPQGKEAPAMSKEASDPMQTVAPASKQNQEAGIILRSVRGTDWSRNF